MRTREEIESKRLELAESAGRLDKKIKINNDLKLLSTGVLLISGLIIAFISGGVPEKYGTLVGISLLVFGATMLVLIGVFSVRRNRAKKSFEHKKEISRSLKEILEILTKPDGTEDIYRELDRLIIEKNQGIRRIEKMFSISEDAQVEDKKLEWRIEAFTWTVSGGDVNPPQDDPKAAVFEGEYGLRSIEEIRKRRDELKLDAERMRIILFVRKIVGGIAFAGSIAVITGIWKYITPGNEGYVLGVIVILLSILTGIAIVLLIILHLVWKDVNRENFEKSRAKEIALGEILDMLDYPAGESKVCLEYERLDGMFREGGPEAVDEETRRRKGELQLARERGVRYRYEAYKWAVRPQIDHGDNE